MQDTNFSKNDIFTSHQNNDYMDFIRSTIVLQLPNKEEILTNITKCDLLFLARVGIARCHEADVYKKKVGRAIALQKMNFHSFEIDKIRVLNNEPSQVSPECGDIVGLEIDARATITYLKPIKNQKLNTELHIRFVLENNRSHIRIIRAWYSYSGE